MPDNEIIMSKAFAPFGDDIRERLNWLRNFRESAKQRKATQTQNTLDMDSNNLYEQSLNVNNKELSQRYNQASQSAAAASMIKSYAERNGDDWSDLNTPQEILTEYLTINDDDNTYNRLMDFVKSSQDPEEFWIEMWWIEPVKESFGDKAKNSIVWPFARAIWTIWGTIWWIWEWTWNALKRAYNNMWDIREIAWDDNKSFIEKFNQILIWEIGLDTIWGSVWDIIWGWIGWAVKWFTTQWERDSMSNAVAWFFKKALETDMGEAALEKWNSLTPEQQKEAKDYLTYIDWAMNLSLGWAARTPIKAWAKGIAEWVTAAKEWISNQIKKQAVKNAIKNATQNEEWLRKVANVIWQWATKDIDNSVKALQTISKHSDLTSLSNFQELDNASNAVERKLLQVVDENLWKYTDVIKASDQKVVNVDWQEMWKVVDDAIADLRDVYSKQRNAEGLKDLIDFEKRFQWEWVSYKELNDFARKYGSEMDSWNAKNQLTTDAKVWTETTRSGIKDLIRERVPEAELKDIDSEIGSIANFRKLVQKSIEKANNTEKTLREKWVLESIRKTYSDIKNTITWTPRWETENIYHIQERLPKLLEEFDTLNNKLQKANKAESETLIKQAWKDFIKASKNWAWLSDEIKNNKGITFDLKNNINLGGKDYTSVSPYPNRTLKVPTEQLTDDMVKEYAKKNMTALMRDWHALGAWVNDNEWLTYLDVAAVIPNKYKDRAIELWKKYNQEAVFDLKTFDEIPTWWDWNVIEIDEDVVRNDIKDFLK